MSIDGEEVSINFLFLSYTPFSKKSNKTLFSFEAHISLFTGNPICFAIYAAKIFPKFPVGTHTFIFSLSSISPFSRSFKYAYT